MTPATPITDATLYRLMTWLSPTYPVGAFSYSHGLEWAVEAGDVTGRDALAVWLADILAHGGGRNDAILFAHAYRAAAKGDGAAVVQVAALAVAWTASRERRLETIAQGAAFRIATQAAWATPSFDLLADVPDDALAYPVAVAVAAAGHAVPLRAALGAFLQALAANLVSAGMRLVPLGQTDGQRALAALEPVVAATLAAALDATLDDLGGAALGADLAAMLHETQYTRLFRT
ncbi:MAG: urease accessory protein UreF [Alphaproteobacteria bacterium]|nr:urease accessory protein UreF [Alphaproteobacteria bacterium]